MNLKIFLLTLALLSTLSLSSGCGVDSADPSSLSEQLNRLIEPIRVGETERVKPASFGIYDKMINPHPLIRQNSLYRSFTKSGRNYIFNPHGSDEIRLQGNHQGTTIELTLYKENLSSSLVGEFRYREITNGEPTEIETSKTEFRAIKMGDDESQAFLVLKLFQIVNDQERVTKEWTLTLLDDQHIMMTIPAEDPNEEDLKVQLTSTISSSSCATRSLRDRLSITGE